MGACNDPSGTRPIANFWNALSKRTRLASTGGRMHDKVKSRTGSETKKTSSSRKNTLRMHGGRWHGATKYYTPSAPDGRCCALWLGSIENNEDSFAGRGPLCGT